MLKRFSKLFGLVRSGSGNRVGFHPASSAAGETCRAFFTRHPGMEFLGSLWREQIVVLQLPFCAQFART